MNRKIIGSAYFVGIMLLCCQSYAGVIGGPTTINLDPTGGSNVIFDGSVFNTAPITENPASTLTLGGFLDKFSSPSNEFVSISIQGVEAFGDLVTDTSVGSGIEFLFQGTVGGDFEIRDLNNDLLLSGDFGSGVINAVRNGGRLSSAGGFLSDVTFTDGLILEHIDSSGDISLSLSEIVAISDEGLGFEANITAEITVSQVPEPSTLFMFSPILIGLFVRRRSGGCRLGRRV